MATLSEVVANLKRGGIGVLPTDTIYGLIGLALNKETVERIYQVKKRNSKKPFIILINSIADVKLFGVELTQAREKVLRRLWPGKVSVVLPCSPAAGFHRFFYLHRGTRALAFRLPRRASLRALLRKTGPLVAPSANPEKKRPAATVEEAQAYFGEHVDFYYAGKLAKKQTPSTVISLTPRNKVKILRQGAAKIVKTLLAA